MNLELKIYHALCACEIFKINGKDADYEDFGDKSDEGADYADDYACGNMRFRPDPATQEVLDKYGITTDEYNEICKQLDGLSFGSCGWCV